MSLLECSLSHLVTTFLVTSALLSLFLFNFNVSVPFSEHLRWNVHLKELIRSCYSTLLCLRYLK